MKPNTRTVVGAQWGDEGKGKVVDYFAESADMIVRFAGGNNAGHTLIAVIEKKKRKLVLHLIPSAAMYPGKTLVLGNQMVVDPAALAQEIADLKKIGLLQNDRELLRISKLAHLIMPYHIALDKLREAKSKNPIGTTGRGIGPAYEYKAARCGIRMSALRHPELFPALAEKALAKANPEIEQLYGTIFATADMINFLAEARKNLLPYITNTNLLVHRACAQGQRVLFEGAQGAGLDIDNGTYPFVTSSNTLAAGACLGSGIGPQMMGGVLGVAKAYATRVGEGPFPSRMPEELEEQIRQAGGEFGATTGRPRNCGWIDIPQLRLAVRANGMYALFITKLDVLRGIHPVKICRGYEFPWGERVFDLDDADMETVAEARPIYDELPGFDEDISGARESRDIPKNAQELLVKISWYADVPICGVSVGPERDQTIWLKK